MPQPYEFDVSFDWEVEDGVSLPVRVFGRKNPVIAENRKGHPDTWSPAEGGELEDLQVFSGARLPRDVENRLLEDERFLETVEAAL